MAEQIASEISDQIVSGALPPGTWVTELQLSAEYGVSRGPVREALHILNKAGVVELLPRRGARVVRLTATEIDNIYQIRAVLHGLTARLAAGAPALPILDLAEEGYALLQELVARRDTPTRTFMETRGGISMLIGSVVDNPQLVNLIAQLERQIIGHNLGLERQARRAESLTYWRKLLDALRSGDAEAAEQISRAQVLAAREEIMRALEANPGAEVQPSVRRATARPLTCSLPDPAI